MDWLSLLNNSLVRNIKKPLEENKRAWNTKLKYALWEEIISSKRAIGMSPFLLVYGEEVNFPVSLGIPITKLLHLHDEESNHMKRRINKLIELYQMRDK